MVTNKEIKFIYRQKKNSGGGRREEVTNHVVIKTETWYLPTWNWSSGWGLYQCSLALSELGSCAINDPKAENSRTFSHMDRNTEGLGGGGVPLEPQKRDTIMFLTKKSFKMILEA